MEGVTLAHAADAAVEASHHADRIELCGGMGVDEASRVHAAIGEAVAVRLNRYGFESLEQVAAYKVGFDEGSVGDGAFLYGAAQSTPLTQHEGVMVAGIAVEVSLVERSREAQARGASLIELCGGLGIRAAAIAREATGRKLPVGFID